MRIAGIATLALLLLLSGTHAVDAKPKVKDPAAHERDTAINAGIRYLDRTLFQLPDAAGTPRKQFTIAVTGLVYLLARDGVGLRTDGKAGVKKARAYLAKYVAEVAQRTADPSQIPAQAGRISSNQMMQYTWPLAMTALFLGELHARGVEKAAARREIGRIVGLLVEAQAPNGGWGHGRVGDKGKARGASVMDGFGGYPDTLLASSNLVATSLGLVQGVAAPKPKDTLDRARAYYRYAELANGNFPYDPSQRAAHTDLTGVSRAAGAVLAMRALDVPWKDRAIVRALEYVDDHFEYLSEGHGSSTHNLLLCALLQRARGEQEWQRFKHGYFGRILKLQKEDGSFGCICRNKAFGSTNDDNPFGGKSGTPFGGKSVGKVSRSGSGKGFGGIFEAGTKTYVTAIHTLILLLDRSPPRITGHAPAAPERGPVTPGRSKR